MRLLSMIRVVLAGFGILGGSATLHAQPMIEVLGACVKVTHNKNDLIAETDVRIHNLCGTPIHAYWGNYFSAEDIGSTEDQGHVLYELDLQPGQTVQLPFGSFMIRAFGCPAMPIANHPNGYTVVYRANPGATVKQYSKIGSLACAPSPETQQQPHDPRYWQPR